MSSDKPKNRDRDGRRLKVIARVFDHVPLEGDLLAVLIKGHLIVEEQLNEALCKAVKNPQYLEKSRLRFEQLFNIAKAHYFHEKDSWLWGAVSKLNSIRNQMAHRLEPDDLPKLTEEFLELARPGKEGTNSLEEEVHKAIALVAAGIYELHEDAT